MLQQRTYTETRFPFVRRVNNGQRNQYLIKDSHPPIVTHEEAEAVRNLMAYRVDVLHMNKSDYTKRYLFSGRIICRGMRKNLPAAAKSTSGETL